MPRPERQQQVLELLKGLRGIEPLKQLFWSELNYQRVNEPLSRRGWTDSAAQALADDPILFAGGGENNDFHVIYGRLASDRLLLGAERPVVSRLVREHPYALFVFSNKAQDRWHFLNVKYDKAVERRQLFRRITVVPGDGLRTAGERIALLNLEEIGADRSPLTIQEQHDAAFDVEKVTKDFYAEIANWYFWACDHVTFPVPPGTKDLNAYKAQSLIRLITRLIFCWFVKEKGLIPGELFDSRALAKLLKAGAELPASEETTYYKAILQNLFFATLNQEMGKREFRKRNAHGRDPHRGITNLYRYEDYFTDPKAFLRLMDGIPFLNGGLFECLDKVYRAEEKLPDVRIDGFSDHPKNPLSVPDFLFFGDERTVDLEKAYGEKRYRQATVRGLIHTFNRYNFTVTENTPLDQEVALDPELAGKVFENLLAAYNPETATTARKQTGSFYTPREIVDYMVDEALMAYLETALANGGPRSVVADAPKTDATERVPPNTEARLQRLLSWEDTGHDFTPQEVERLIDAIDNLKVLDPACGSGAFPMGLLHKLVFILGKLDPHNEQWKQQQIAKASEIPDATVREKTLADIEQAFAANELDYGRKLYLIENCIYGVDIQPIAVQIAKMRFFISLIVDQTPSSPPSSFSLHPSSFNLGIRPLPNLETKFVAANTLIGIEKPESQGKLFADAKLTDLMRELADVRHQMFTAKSPRTKQRLRERDEALRTAMAEQVKRSFIRAAKEEEQKTRQALEQAKSALAEEKAKPPEWHITRFKNLFGEDDETRIDLSKERKQRLADRIKELEASLRRTTQVTKEIDAIVHQLANWNPYDQNASADFFDPEWMFGIREGFDIVTGNPPYVRQEEIKELKPALQAQGYTCHTGTADLYVYFYERALQILHDGGVLSFISSNKFFRSAYGEKLRALLAKQTIHRIIDFGDAPVFTAIAYPAILLLSKAPVDGHNVRALNWELGPPIEQFPDIVRTQSFHIAQSELKPDGWRLESPAVLRLLEKLRAAGKPLGEYVNGRFYRGIVTGLNEAWVVDRATRDRLIAEHESSAEVLKPFLRGRDIKRWRVEFADQYLIKIESSENKQHPWSGKPPAEAEKIFAKTYPAIHARFEDFRRDLIARDDQGKYFWELRSCVYWLEFEQPKIVIPAIEQTVSYAPDLKGHYSNDKTTICVSHQINYLLSLLNSSALWWFIRATAATKQGGFYEFKPMYVGQLPIPSPPRAEHDALVKLVERILAAKRADAAADVTAWEREIDERVYRLYRLTAAEIKLVEESVKR